jgi:chromosome segregation ATPase
MHQVVEFHPRVPSSEVDPGEESRPVRLAAVEERIEEIGARYLDDLRALSADFDHFYQAALTAKEEQLAAVEGERDALREDLARLRADATEKKAQIDALTERIATAEERARAAETVVHSFTSLRALTDELRQRVEAAERMRDALSSESVRAQP